MWRRAVTASQVTALAVVIVLNAPIALLAGAAVLFSPFAAIVTVLCGANCLLAARLMLEARDPDPSNLPSILPALLVPANGYFLANALADPDLGHPSRAAAAGLAVAIVAIAKIAVLHPRIQRAARGPR